MEIAILQLSAKEKFAANLDIMMKNMVHMQVVKGQKKLNKPLTEFLQIKDPFRLQNAKLSIHIKTYILHPWGKAK